MKKRKTLGRAEKRRYDLPLNRGDGTGFLITLIGLMILLAMLALCASFTLSAMTHRWSSGLENRLTIEIPAQTTDGKLMAKETIFVLTRDVANALTGMAGIKSIHVLSNDEISALVEPWLGKDLLDDHFPVPGIIALETGDASSAMLQSIYSRARQAAPNARMDTHEEWLKDLLRFTGALQLAAILLVAVIGVTTVTAVAGAVRARMAIHHAEVEILHLMGASDQYITRQFQRHSLILALQGGLAGAACAGLMIGLIHMIAGEMGVAILPDFRLNGLQMALLLLTPLAGAAIATITARLTVMKALAAFP